MTNPLVAPARHAAATAEPANPILEVKNLTLDLGVKERPKRVIDDVSFSLGVGETLGLVGQSGSGKSMTAFAVMGLLRRLPVVSITGSIKLSGQEMLGLPRDQLRHLRGEKIAMIMQDPMSSLNPAFTVGQQISQTILAHKQVSRKQAMDRAVEMLRLAEIPAAQRRINSYPHEFSGGMRQRVMLAMALSCEPQVLIADEPTTALDVTIQAQMLDLLRRLQAELGMSILFITHDLGVVASICHRVAVMYAAQIIESAPVDDLFGQVRHPYTENLLQSSPEYLSVEQAVSEEMTRRSLAASAPIPDTGCRFRPRCQFAQPQCEQEIDLVPRGAPNHPVRCVRANEIQLESASALGKGEWA